MMSFLLVGTSQFMLSELIHLKKMDTYDMQRSFLKREPLFNFIEKIVLGGVLEYLFGWLLYATCSHDMRLPS